MSATVDLACSSCYPREFYERHQLSTWPLYIWWHKNMKYYCGIMDNITLNFRNELPEELDALLDGIEVNEQLQTIDYKLLRDEMYAKRPI